MTRWERTPGYVPKRTHYNKVAFASRAHNEGEYDPNDDGRVSCDPQDAQVVSSEIKESSLHSPVLDIDFPARLVPSSTPGHFHLYLDGLSMTWQDYEKLLNSLAAAGVVQEGYVYASIARKATAVRVPGCKKEPVAPLLVTE